MPINLGKTSLPSNKDGQTMTGKTMKFWSERVAIFSKGVCEQGGLARRKNDFLLMMYAGKMLLLLPS